MEKRPRKPVLSGKVNRGAGGWRPRGAGAYVRRQHRDAAESMLSHQRQGRGKYDAAGR